MTDLERAALLHIVVGTPARLKAALKGVPKKLLLWTPGPGKWSILEIVAHMRDMERDAYLDRYRRILAEDNPTLPDLDGDVIAIRDDYRSLKLSELMRDWLKLRKECLKLLKSVKGQRWERTGTHETAGPLSMDALLRRHAMGNDEAHLGQIEGIKKRAAALEAIEAGPGRVAQLTKKLDGGVLRLKPAPDRWSALEVVCHLRDVEKLWVDRIVKVAFSDRPAFYTLDFEALVSKQSYNTQDLTAALKELARLRADTVCLLRALPASQWKRTGMHPKRGEISIERIVEIMIGHDRGHLDQIAKAVAAS
ncbi:MAG TPA: DinB family protein [Vicinamibacteria bacterium]|nr:DinB family protein [Vicinamibacteria bacterium]